MLKNSLAKWLSLFESLSENLSAFLTININTLTISTAMTLELGLESNSDPYLESHLMLFVIQLVSKSSEVKQMTVLF